MENTVEHPELSCARCGACTVVCPVFRAESREALTARGKMHLLSLPLAAHPSSHFQDIFSRCLLCGACEEVCSRNLPITDLVIRARSGFPGLYGRHGLHKMVARKALASPMLLQALVKAGISVKRMKALPADSGLRLKLGLLEDAPVAREDAAVALESTAQADVTYFTGCLAAHLQPSVARAVVGLCKKAGRNVSVPETQGCCGLAAHAAGRSDEARKMAWRTISAFAGSEGPILTSCASCSSHLAGYPDLFKGDANQQRQARLFSERVQEFSSFFLEQPALRFAQASAERKKVLYHDPCHQRFSVSGCEAPRQLLAEVGGVELVEAAGGSRCCGQGGLFHLGYPELSRQIFKRCSDGALVNSPDLVVTTCSGCLIGWQQGVVEEGLSVKVRHPALVLLDCLG